MDGGCYLRNCTKLTSQEPKVKNQCSVPVTAKEDIDGCKFHLSFKWVDYILTVVVGMSELPGVM